MCSGKSAKYQKRLASLSAPENNFYKPPTNSRRTESMAALLQKPLKERIVHLLALKPYRKPELLLWLERERAGAKDKAELNAVLEEVKTSPLIFIQLMCTIILLHFKENIYVLSLLCMCL